MGTLTEMIRFIEKNKKTVETITTKLDKVQTVFNRNFNNVRAVRTSELEFLQDEFFSNPEQFPVHIRTLYKSKVETEGKQFNENYTKLKAQQKKLLEKRKDLDKQRNDHAEKLTVSNTSLDSKEEKLKTKIQDLDNKITTYNTTIGELTTGFGFLVNLGKMKKIEKEKKEILANRDELITEIEEIRGRWVEAEKKIEADDSKTKEKWNNLQTDYALTTEKLVTLEENKDNLIKKAAFTAALQELKGDESFLRKNINVTVTDKCKKCGSENLGNLFFCNYCGEPFAENRPDIEGSLIETGECNRVYAALTAGIQESVSLIALFRGLGKGLDTFLSSVKKVKNSEDTYPQLKKLSIDVPRFSMEFSKNIEDIAAVIEPKYHTLHPHAFAEKIQKSTEKILTDTNIEKFFLHMGQELDRRTKEQW